MPRDRGIGSRMRAQRRFAGAPRWWTLSVLTHVVLGLVLGHVIFRYPLRFVTAVGKQEVRQERLDFVKVQPPAQPAHSGSRASRDTAAASAPARLEAPTIVPARVLPPPDSSVARAAGGRGSGRATDTGDGLATGVMPRQPDPRIALSPTPAVRLSRTVAQDVDSIVEIVVGIVRDSLAVAMKQRQPGDWTVKGKDGEVWGWDPSGNIRLGKFTIPGALLALLPLNMQSRHSPIEQRSMAYIRRDIMEKAERQISEDEFREAVKRIRERKERERREKTIVADDRDSP